MSRFRFKPWMALAAVLLLLVIAFFGTFYISGEGRQSTVAENLAGSAVAPAVSGFSGFTAAIRDFFNRLFALRDVDKNYEELKTRVQVLELENQFMQDLQQENERLTKLLGFEESFPNYECIPAHVIGKEPGSWFINFTLNRGADQGVLVDMTVANELGLIGRVVETGHNWCKVMAIIDRQSGVSALVERSRDNCIVKGSGDPQGTEPTCGIYFLPIDSDIVPGDKVVTTDIGGKFLKGITVGTVSEVSRDQKLQSFAVLTPAVDFSHLEDVLIIKSDKHTTTASDIASEEKAQQKQAQGASK